jgi:hypothetical protein
VELPLQDQRQHTHLTQLPLLERRQHSILTQSGTEENGNQGSAAMRALGEIKVGNKDRNGPPTLLQTKEKEKEAPKAEERRASVLTKVVLQLTSGSLEESGGTLRPALGTPQMLRSKKIRKKLGHGFFQCCSSSWSEHFAED